jgi:hypothetical protein
MPRIWARTGVFLLATLALSAPASAQVVQSVQIGVGVFVPRSFDNRVPGDVLVEDLSSTANNPNPLLFAIGDFRSAQISGEWNVAFGNHLEVGAGVGYFQRSVPSVYRDLVNSDGSEIAQSLRLRVVPVSAVIRFLPLGRASTVQPYAGVGVSALNFRYSETGQFVDNSDLSVFDARYVATGTAVGPLLLVGLRMPIRGDIYAFTVEGRYQFGAGNTGGAANGFVNSKIDLGGWNTTFGFLVRF